MKKIILFLCFSFAVLSVSAQKTSFKIAYFDMDSLLEIMPDVKAVNDTIHTFSAETEKETQLMQQKLDEMIEKYEKTPVGRTLERKAQEEDITAFQQRMTEYREARQTETEEMQNRLMEPVMEKINKTAKKIATEKGYAFVLDSSKSAATVIYANQSYNIMNEMCKELGIVRK